MGKKRRNSRDMPCWGRYQTFFFAEDFSEGAAETQEFQSDSEEVKVCFPFVHFPAFFFNVFVSSRR